MNNPVIHRCLNFILLVLLQSFIFNRLALGTYIQPCIYIMLLLFLPFDYSVIKALLWAFALGLAVDLLSTDIIGINTAASVALAFVRPYILKLFSTKSDFDAFTRPSAKTMGRPPFLGYLSIAVLFHQSLFFLLDSFGIQDLLHTLLRIVASTLSSILFIILLQGLLFGSRKEAV